MPPLKTSNHPASDDRKGRRLHLLNHASHELANASTKREPQIPDLVLRSNSFQSVSTVELLTPQNDGTDEVNERTELAQANLAETEVWGCMCRCELKWAARGLLPIPPQSS